MAVKSKAFSNIHTSATGIRGKKQVKVEVMLATLP